MSNVAGKSYALNVITPMTRWHYYMKALIFIAVRALPNLLAGLRGLSIIHFARWVLIRRKDWPNLGQGSEFDLHYNYTLFCSNFNGTWDQYIDAFSDGIPYMLDLAWYGDYQYPHSIPIGKFKTYIHHNEFDTEYYYNATPGASQRDIKASLRVWRAVKRLEELHKTATPAEFSKAYLETFCDIQNNLGSMGPAPVASIPTEFAHINHQGLVSRTWTGDPDGEPEPEPVVAASRGTY